MFDFSFGEIGLIAVVALVVLGPERLPKVARTAGALVRRARTSWQSVKDEIERELETEDLKRSFNEARNAASDLRDEMHRASSDIESTARQTSPVDSGGEYALKVGAIEPIHSPVDALSLQSPADAEGGAYPRVVAADVAESPGGASMPAEDGTASAAKPAHLS